MVHDGRVLILPIVVRATTRLEPLRSSKQDQSLGEIIIYSHLPQRARFQLSMRLRLFILAQLLLISRLLPRIFISSIWDVQKIISLDL